MVCLTICRCSMENLFCYYVVEQICASLEVDLVTDVHIMKVLAIKTLRFIDRWYLAHARAEAFALANSPTQNPSS